MRNRSLPLAIALCCLLGCGPPASSDEMKNLQARIHLVECLGEVHEAKTLQKHALDSITAYIEKAIADESIKHQLVTMTRKLWESRKNKQAVDQLTREMSQLVPLPEKYERVYGLR